MGSSKLCCSEDMGSSPSVVLGQVFPEVVVIQATIWPRFTSGDSACGGWVPWRDVSGRRSRGGKPQMEKGHRIILLAKEKRHCRREYNLKGQHPGWEGE